MTNCLLCVLCSIRLNFFLSFRGDVCVGGGAAVDCGQPTTPAQSTLGQPSGTTFQSIARVTCDTGYTAGGTGGDITCGADGKWTSFTCSGEFRIVIGQTSSLFFSLDTAVCLCVIRRASSSMSVVRLIIVPFKFKSCSPPWSWLVIRMCPYSLAHKLHSRLVVKSHLSMKLIFGLDRHTSTAFVLSHCRLLEQRLNLKLYIFSYRCLDDLTLPLLQYKNCLKFEVLQLTLHCVTRGQVLGALALPGPLPLYGYHALCFLAADRWNMLRAACRQSQPLATSTREIKIFLGLPVRSHRMIGG